MFESDYFASGNIEELRHRVDEIADQLCLAVSGDFDFTVSSQVADQTLDKLAMLINFVVESARQRLAEIHLRNEKLAELGHLKSAFLSNVSHELRTPLSLLLAPLRTLLAGQHGEVSAQSRLVLERMLRNTERLNLLVNDLLDISKLEADRMAVCWTVVDVAVATCELLQEVAPLAQERGVWLRSEVIEDFGPCLLDLRLLEKIWLNLLSNALKFTPPGGEVGVSLRLLGGWIELSVSDSGPGIDVSKQHELFQRFHQVDPGSSRAYEGTGLGLALVKEFAQLMGGQVSLESAQGRGAKFTVRLPHRLPSTQDRLTVAPTPVEPYIRAKLALAPPEPSASPPGPSTRPLILVVEDNPDLADYIGEIVSADFRVVKAGNGYQALAALQGELPEVILSDIMMPEMDGLELLKRVKGNPQWRMIPMILLTARAGREAQTAGLEEGADDYVCKPFDALELRSRLRAALRTRGLYRDLELAQLQVEAVLESLHNALLVVNADGRIEAANGAAEKLFGRSLVGLPLPVLMGGASLVEGKGSQDCTLTGADGHKIHMSLSTSTLEGRGGKTTVCILTDITEHKHLQEKMRDDNSALAAVNQELEAFSYSVSHDLRAPLRSIDGFSKSLEENYSDLLDARGQNHLQRIRTSAQRMAQLIDDILNLSRLARTEMKRQVVDLTAMARTIASSLPRNEPRAVEFVIAEGLTAWADRNLLQVVLENLFNNAWKFTAKHATALIEFGARVEDGREIFFVKDDGAGFDMKYADQLFGAFQRLHSEAEFSGTGVGLALIKRVIHRHGGEVWASGAVEGGAVFSFTLYGQEQNLENTGNLVGRG